MGPPQRFWQDLRTTDFDDSSVGEWIAVLPIAATEQHGPHLPTGVDTAIADGLVAKLASDMPDGLPAVVLPTLAYGKSDEHSAFPGTLSLTAGTLVVLLCELGRSVARSGLRKLVIVSSHGGNSEAMAIAARELRMTDGMLVVATSWPRMGQPEGLFAEKELRFGIHGGDVETSLMLHLDPGAVRMEKAERFASAAEAMAEEFSVLRGTGGTGFAWATQDLNEAGAVGDAAAATPEKGAASAAHAVERFIALLEDVHRFGMERLR